MKYGVLWWSVDYGDWCKYSVVWCGGCLGMVQYGVAWCSIVCSIVWYGVVWLVLGMTEYGVYGAVWCMAWYGEVLGILWNGASKEWLWCYGARYGVRGASTLATSINKQTNTLP